MEITAIVSTKAAPQRPEGGPVSGNAPIQAPRTHKPSRLRILRQYVQLTSPRDHVNTCMLNPAFCKIELPTVEANCDRVSTMRAMRASKGIARVQSGSL